MEMTNEERVAAQNREAVISWPPEATATPPEYPWKFDRHTYGDRGPLMDERLAR